MLVKYALCFILLITFCARTNVVDGKKGGQSKGRGVINTIKNTITGNRKPGSGTYPVSSNTGWKQTSGGGSFGSYNKPKPKWTSSGRSSWKSSRNRGLLTGALGTMAGAYVGYKVGKTVGKFSHMYNGRNYWYGSRHYSPTGHGRKTCVFEVDESTPNWNVRYENDNTLVRDIVFECYSYEYCCEMSCCRTPTYVRNNGSRWRWWHTILVLLFLGILIAACAFSATKMFNKRRQNQRTVVTATTYDDESSKPFNPSGGMSQPYPTQQQPYQPYPTDASYPPQYGAYPPQPQLQQTYGYPQYPQQTYAPPSYQ